MAEFPTETHRFASFDGVELAWTELGPGDGRPVLMFHGFFSDSQTNWIRYGHARRIAERGFRVVMADLRGHGLSARPHGAAYYPPDVTQRDGFALIAALGVSDYDLVGYSLGARTAVRMLVNGAAPRRVVLGGMGLEGLIDTGARADHFRDILTHLGQHERGSPEWMAEAFLKTVKGDPEALLGMIESWVDTQPAEIAAIREPVLVLSGEEDEDNGSHASLLALLPNATERLVPGGHMSAVTRPELGEAIAEFLAG